MQHFILSGSSTSFTVSVGPAAFCGADGATISFPGGSVDVPANATRFIHVDPGFRTVSAASTLDESLGVLVGKVTSGQIGLTTILSTVEYDLGSGGGILVSDQKLIEWTAGEAFQVTSATVDSDGSITTGTVLWPDGAGGTYTRFSKDATFLVANSFAVTHTPSAKIVGQSTITRDPATGVPTTKPALRVTS